MWVPFFVSFWWAYQFYPFNRESRIWWSSSWIERIQVLLSNNFSHKCSTRQKKWKRLFCWDLKLASVCLHTVVQMALNESQSLLHKTFGIYWEVFFLWTQPRVSSYLFVIWLGLLTNSFILLNNKSHFIVVLCNNLFLSTEVHNHLSIKVQ